MMPQINAVFVIIYSSVERREKTLTVPRIVLNYHIKRLRDKNPQVRLNAIEELRKIGDPEAMQPLQEVFQNDDDMQVKRAAQQAGREIWQSQGDSKAK
jgi:vesicle coat complex subunit